jgi:hypothetical protein
VFEVEVMPNLSHGYVLGVHGVAHLLALLYQLVEVFGGGDVRGRCPLQVSVPG